MSTQCGAIRQNCADSRLHELQMNNVNLDYSLDEVLKFLDEYNTRNKHR